MINFSSYNYLAMSGDPEITQAAKDALDSYRHQRLGQPHRVGRKDHPSGMLEREIADFVGATIRSSTWAATPPTRPPSGTCSIRAI
jgi:7-keto-8-aminopelargonate synthetase-like enzyme